MSSNPTGEEFVRLINAFTEALAESHGYPVGNEKRNQLKEFYEKSEDMSWMFRNMAGEDMRDPADLPPLDFVAPGNLTVEYTLPAPPRPNYCGSIYKGERVVFEPHDYEDGDGSWYLDTKENCHVAAQDVPRIHKVLVKLQDAKRKPKCPNQK